MYNRLMNNMIIYSVSLEADLQVRPCGTGPLRTHIVPAFSRAAQFVRMARPVRAPKRQIARRRSFVLMQLQRPDLLCLVVLYTYKRLGGMPAVLCNAAEKRPKLSVINAGNSNSGPRFEARTGDGKTATGGLRG